MKRREPPTSSSSARGRRVGSSPAVSPRRGSGCVCLEQGRWHDRSEYRGAGARLGAHGSQAVVGQPERPRAAGGLSGRRRRLRSLAADVRRRRRIDAAVRGCVAAAAAVGLPGPLARRCGRRLAAHATTSCGRTTSATTGTSACRGSAATRRTHPARTRRCRRCRSVPAALKVARAHDRLGWHWWPEPNAILSAPYDGRHQCVQRGTCMQGCNEGAKASTDLTHWPQALANGARLVTGARVHAHRDERARSRDRGRVARRRRPRALPGRERRRPGRQRDRHRPAVAAVVVGRPSRRARQLERPRRHAADDASVRQRVWAVRRRLSRAGRATSAARSNRSSSTRPTSAAGSSAARSGASRRRAVRSTPRCRAAPASRCGGPTTTSRCAPASGEARAGGSSARTCPTSRTACSCRPTVTDSSGFRLPSCTTRCRPTPAGCSTSTSTRPPSRSSPPARTPSRSIG